MKKKFLNPEISISKFDMENIVTVSNLTQVTDDLNTALNGEVGATNGGISTVSIVW